MSIAMRPLTPANCSLLFIVSLSALGVEAVVSFPLGDVAQRLSGLRFRNGDRSPVVSDSERAASA